MSSPIEKEDVEYCGTVLAITWTLSALCILVVAARFAVVRMVAKRGWGADDWIMLLAVFFQIIYESFVTISTEAKLESLRSQVPNPDAVKYSMLSSIPATHASITARISASILLIRLFGTKVWFKWYLIIMTGTVTLVGILSIIFYMGRTDPINALWNPEELRGYRWSTNAQIIPGSLLAFETEALLAWSDLTYVLFPVIIVWKLQMPLRRKIGLGVLLGMSLFTMAAAILKALITLGSQTLGLQFRVEDGLLWAGVEQTLVIIIGSIPSIVPIVRLPSAFSQWHSLLPGRLGATTQSTGQQEPNENSPMSKASQGLWSRATHPLREQLNRLSPPEETDEIVLTMVDGTVSDSHLSGSQLDYESSSSTKNCGQSLDSGSDHLVAYSGKSSGRR